MRLYLRKNGEFGDDLKHVKKSAISYIMCASVKFTALVWSEKIPSEY